MTAVMRAVVPTGPKVLRVGVVQGGRVVDERIIKQRGHVTVGTSEKNLFVVTSPLLPSSFRLFELIGGEYHLSFLDGMQGRVALPTGVADLNVLKGQARRTSQGAYQVRLTEDSRGKIVIGSTTFLFQFVAPPPMQPRPRLPVAVLRGTTSMDWKTTIIGAFSFLFHFLLLGAIYSDWLDPVVDDQLSVAGLIDSLKSLPPPPEVEEKSDQASEESPESDQAKEAAKQKPNEGPKGEKGAISQAEAAALSNDLEQLEMATLASLTSTGPATADVLRGGEVATGPLDEAAKSGAGVGVGGDDLRIGGAGGAVRPGAAGGGLADIGAKGRGTGSEGVGSAQKVSGPKGNASVGGASVSGGTVSNASRVVAGMRAGFRACYQRGLSENPDAQGSIRLTIRVGPGGEVQSVAAVPSGNLPASVIACVKARASAAQFNPPEGGAAAVVVPVTFVKQ